MGSMNSIPVLLAIPWFAAILAAPAGGGTPRLYWGDGAVGEWNTSASNWVSLPYDTNFTVFKSGDSVAAFYVALFIGQDGVPIPVAPSNAMFAGQTLVHGGDIVGPATVFIVDEESDVIFSNYAGGLSFTGGTVLTDEGTLIIDANAMPQAATLWFGQGPMIFDEGLLRIRSASPLRSITLANELSFEDGGGIDFSACSGPVTISGPLRLFSTLNMTTGGALGDPPVRIIGPIQVGDARADPPALWRGFNSVRDLVVEGNMINEPERSPETLKPLELLNFDRGTLRFTGANTFTQGCHIVGHPLVGLDPAGVDYSIEVAAGSSLGTGDLQVETNALLRLLGAGNVHPSARLSVQGNVYVASNVTVTCRELTLGGQIHTSGTFDRNNSDGHIVGPGSIRVQCGTGTASVPPLLTIRFSEPPARPGVVLSFTTAPCQSYQIDVTTSLAHPEWDAVATIDASADPRSVSVPIDLNPVVRRLFFRASSPALR